MEPAAERRGDLAGENLVKLPGAAAMEPAAERRGDLENGGENVSTAQLPQWSPPLNGGVTRTARVRTAPQPEPQWSPPLNGGVTLTGHCPGLPGRRCRNGARR